MSLCSLSPGTGCQGKACLSTCCLSPGVLREAPESRGMHVSGVCVSRVWGRTATVSVDTYAWTKLYTKIMS